MTEYDAGPGEWSDRPWEDPDKKQKPHAKRRRVALPPWALLAILVAIIIALCAGLILVVQAIRGGGDETPTPAPTATRAAIPTFTPQPVAPTSQTPPTATVVLPVSTPEGTAAPAEIGPGALVVVQGTQGSGLNLRTEPGTGAQVVINVREGTVLTVIEGPEEADGYTWWRMRAPGGEEGWGAANWIALQQ
ncbi:MAG TPA: SH3 domain-containing protein [Anaerolineae bacterium]|nr:SH3 domain-containing protein [Anaerolineae bacterium]